MLQISEFGSCNRNKVLTVYHQGVVLESICKNTQLGMRELGLNPRSHDLA